jgi:hypothetical protein
MFGVVESVSEIEVHFGVFEPAPTDLTPTYELWVVQREKWLAPVPGAVQYEKDRKQYGLVVAGSRCPPWRPS